MSTTKPRFASPDDAADQNKDLAAERDAEQLAALWRRFTANRDPMARERLVLTYAPLAKYVAGRIGSTLRATLTSRT